VLDVDHWLTFRSTNADTLLRLLAIRAVWDDRAPALAPPRVRKAAVATIDEAVSVRIHGDFVPGLVGVAMRTFGPRLAVTLVTNYLENHRASHTHWKLVLVALDELAAWATATELHGVPASSRIGRSRR
jgi:hypothetical protein